MFEVWFNDADYDQARSAVEKALNECDEGWPKFVRLLKSPQT